MASRESEKIYPDLAKMKVTDTFYELRKLNPLDVMVAELHAPRKHRTLSRRLYKNSLSPVDEEKVPDWNEVVKTAGLNIIFGDTERKMVSLRSRCGLIKQPIPNNLFSWSLKDCINRLELSNSLYIDLVEFAWHYKDLDNFKLQLDLAQVLEIHNEIVAAFFNNQNLADEIIPTLKGYAKRDEYQTKLNQQFAHAKVHHQNLNETVNRNLIFPDAKLKDMGPKVTRLQEIDMQSEALIPIQDRYKVNWYRTKTFFKKMKNYAFLKQTRDAVNELYYLIALEEDLAKPKMTMYNIHIEDFTKASESLAEKFDMEYDSADNEVGLIRSQITKAIDDLKNMKEQVEFFKKAVIKTRAIIENEELQRQMALQEQEKPVIVKRPSKQKPAKKEKKY